MGNWRDKGKAFAVPGASSDQLFFARPSQPGGASTSHSGDWRAVMYFYPCRRYQFFLFF